MAVTALDEEVHRVLSTVLDGAFYRATYRDLRGVDPVKHYVQSGWREGRDPAPWFSVSGYLQAHDDVRISGVEPLHHYMTKGWREGREAPPSDHGARYLLQAGRRGEALAWRFLTADMEEPSVEDLAAEAAIEAEAAEAARAAEAAQAAQAQAQAEAEALEAALAEAAERAAAALLQTERNLVAPEFDADYYRSHNPDIGDIDPLNHFLSSGWRERRDPNANFSLKEYLDTYPDIAEARINPFVHFLHAGRAEGRLARNELGFRYEMIAGLRPIGERVAAVIKASGRLKPADGEALAAALSQSRTGLSDLHLTFSHDDYTANTGGVQLCLQREARLIADRGYDHLHLYPAKPWPVVRTAAEAGYLGVVLNGRRVGVFSLQAIVETLRASASAVQARARSLAIHSLLGHAADDTADIADALGVRQGFFWLHDFASLCAGYHLLRNDVQDCAAPPPDSAACGICAYGPWRGRHLAEHERLFDRLELTVVAPSQPTLDLWRSSWRFADKAEIVHPHARLVEREAAPAVAAERPLRLAYVGMPASHKGWPIFLELVQKHAKDPRYTFLHLGGQSQPGLPLEFHKVVVTAAKPRAMQDMLEALEVDAVLMWPLCQETFSFAAYEAVAAGAAVITGPDSGNVAAFVESSGHGWVLPTEAALAATLESGDIAKLSRASRKPMLYDLDFSGVTVDLLPRETGR